MFTLNEVAEISFTNIVEIWKDIYLKYPHTHFYTYATSVFNANSSQTVLDIRLLKATY